MTIGMVKVLDKISVHAKLNETIHGAFVRSDHVNSDAL